MSAITDESPRPHGRPAVIAWAGAARSLRAYLPTAVAAVVLVAHALHFNFVNDDAYISFRYARNLALHGQLVFNLGERVEGFTNFLWTVLLAGGIRLGVAPEIAARALGVFFAVCTLGVVNRISLFLDDGRPRAMHFLAPLGLATSSAFACWTTGGLETQLFTFLFMAGVGLLLNEIATERGFASGVPFALAAMTRPEGVLLFGLAAGYRYMVHLRRTRSILPARWDVYFALAFLVVFGPYVAWRWAYYGWPFPNTFYVKSSADNTAALSMGLYYLRRLAEDHLLYAVGPLILLGWPRGPRRRSQARLYEFSTIVAVAYAVYTAKVGGDFMGLYRFVLPVFPLGALLIQLSVARLTRRLEPIVTRPIAWVTVLVLTGGHVAMSVKLSREAMNVIGADRGIDTPGYLKHYAEERIPVGKWFAQHRRPDDLMTVGGAGVIPYYADIPAYDVFGLVDERIAHDPAMTVSARPGHQKWGSDAYMVSRRPTLITHIYHLHAAAAPNAEYWRGLGYEWVTAAIPGLSHPPLYSFLKRIDRAFGPFPAGQ